MIQVNTVAVLQTTISTHSYNDIFNGIPCMQQGNIWILIMAAGTHPQDSGL